MALMSAVKRFAHKILDSFRRVPKDERAPEPTQASTSDATSAARKQRLLERFARTVRRSRQDRKRRESIENIDDNATIEARDRLADSDAAAEASGNPAEKGGEG